MHLQHETQQAVDKAVRDVFRRAALYDEMHAVIIDWLSKQGVLMGTDGYTWRLRHCDEKRAGLPIEGKFITFALAFERALAEIEGN